MQLPARFERFDLGVVGPDAGWIGNQGMPVGPNIAAPVTRQSMSIKPKVAVFLEYPLAAQGGVSVLTRSIIEDLGGEISFVLVSPDSAEDLCALPSAQKLARHFRWPEVKQAPSREFGRVARRLLDELIPAKVNLCHFHCGGVFGWGNRWPGCSISAMLRVRGIPSVWTNHSVVGLLHGYCGPQKPLWFKLAMLPFAWLGKAQQLAAVDAEICVSNHDAGKMRRWYFPFRGKIRRIYHSRVMDGELRGARAGERRPLILSVGHIAWRKGQHVLTEAFAMVAADHPEWELHMAGEILEQDCADRILQITKKHGLQDRIKLLGARDDAGDLMRGCGIFVQPSLEEALGLALQEALLCACPSIGTMVGGIPEMIRNGESGLLVPAGSPQAMALSLSTLLSDPDLRSRLGEGALRSPQIKDMTRDHMVAAHADLYHYLARIHRGFPAQGSP